MPAPTTMFKMNFFPSRNVDGCFSSLWMNEGTNERYWRVFYLYFAVFLLFNIQSVYRVGYIVLYAPNKMENDVIKIRLWTLFHLCCVESGGDNTKKRINFYNSIKKKTIVYNSKIYSFPVELFVENAMNG